MREARLTRMIRTALLPTLAAGVCMAASAQNNAMGTDASKSGAMAGSAHAMAGAKLNARANSSYRGMQASKMIGMEVHNPKGENIGKINDLVVDMKNGNVLYSILEFDPGIFQGEKLFAVPTKQLRMDAKGDALSYNMTRDRLEKAGVDRSAWDTTFRDPNYMKGLDRTWGTKQASNNGRTMRVSDLIGKDVRSRAGDDIGEIGDLVINMSAQKVQNAVLTFDPSMASSEKRYLFPLHSFSMKNGDDEITLDVDKNKLASMKSYPADGHDFLNNNNGNRNVMQKSRGMTTANDEQSFKRLDTNGDGQISKQEFMAHDGADMKR